MEELTAIVGAPRAGAAVTAMTKIKDPKNKPRGLERLVFTLPATAAEGAGGSQLVVSHQPQVVYLVGETKPFRDVARQLPLPASGAKVVEVGFSYGDTLNILAKRCQGNVVGFDCSQVSLSGALSGAPQNRLTFLLATPPSLLLSFFFLLVFHFLCLSSVSRVCYDGANS
jgi:hypothetical protein